MRIFKKINIDQGTFRGFKDVPKKMEPEDWKIFCKLIKFYQNYLDIKYFSVIEKIKAICREKLDYDISEYKREEFSKVELAIHGKEFVQLLEKNNCYLLR